MIFLQINGSPAKIPNLPELIAANFTAQYPEHPAYAVPIVVNLTFHFAPNKKEKVGQPSTKAPALKTLANIVLDSLKGLAYKDEKFIYEIHANKCVGDSDGIHIHIFNIDEPAYKELTNAIQETSAARAAAQ